MTHGGTVKPILWYIFFPPAIKLCHQSERVLADSPSATAAVMHCYHIFKTNLMVSFSTSWQKAGRNIQLPCFLVSKDDVMRNKREREREEEKRKSQQLLMVSVRPIWMLGEQGEWGGVRDAQSVTRSLREPHTTHSVAYLPCVSEWMSECVTHWCVSFTRRYLWCSILCISMTACLCLGERKQHSGGCDMTSNSWLLSVSPEGRATPINSLSQRLKYTHLMGDHSILTWLMSQEVCLC